VARGNLVDPAGVGAGGVGAMMWRLFQIAVFAGFVWFCYAVAAEDGSEITRPGMMMFFGAFFAWFLTLFLTIYIELFASLKRRFFGKKHLGHHALPVSPTDGEALDLPDALRSRGQQIR
jgi:hypothetical protein